MDLLVFDKITGKETSIIKIYERDGWIFFGDLVKEFIKDEERLCGAILSFVTRHKLHGYVQFPGIFDLYKKGKIGEPDVINCLRLMGNFPGWYHVVNAHGDSEYYIRGELKGDILLWKIFRKHKVGDKILGIVAESDHDYDCSGNAIRVFTKDDQYAKDEIGEIKHWVKMLYTDDPLPGEISPLYTGEMSPPSATQEVYCFDNYEHAKGMRLDLDSFPRRIKLFMFLCPWQTVREGLIVRASSNNFLENALWEYRGFDIVDVPKIKFKFKEDGYNGNRVVVYIPYNYFDYETHYVYTLKRDERVREILEFYQLPSEIWVKKQREDYTEYVLSGTNLVDMFVKICKSNYGSISAVRKFSSKDMILAGLEEKERILAEYTTRKGNQVSVFMRGEYVGKELLFQEGYRVDGKERMIEKQYTYPSDIFLNVRSLLRHLKEEGIEFTTTKEYESFTRWNRSG